MNRWARADAPCLFAAFLPGLQVLDDRKIFVSRRIERGMRGDRLAEEVFGFVKPALEHRDIAAILIFLYGFYW